jgi:uncharacterized membrane protein
MFTPGYVLIMVSIFTLSLLFGSFFLLAGAAPLAIFFFLQCPAIFLITVVLKYIRFKRYKNFNN